MQFSLSKEFLYFSCPQRIKRMSNKPRQDIEAIEGVVVKSTGSWYTVMSTKGKKIDCKIKGRFRKLGLRTTNPVAVGDRVRVSVENQITPVITEIFDRKNFIVRKASKLSKQSQIIAANIDQAILLASMISPKTHIEFIDRFLVSAEAYRIPAILVFNKIDSYSTDLVSNMKQLISVYKKIGYGCLDISVKDGTNLSKLKKQLKGKVSLLSGNSGVGKTTLINKLDPSHKLATAEISDYHQMGKHTTTFAQMHELYFGGYIIDTPGIKGFGLVHMDKDEIYHFFPEIFLHSKKCKYYNCKHIDEPGCGVVMALKEGQISNIRYRSYVSLYLEEEEKYRK